MSGKGSTSDRLDRIESALDRIEAKQDQVLEFRTWLQGKVESLTGTSENTLGMLARAAMSSMLAGRNGGDAKL